MYGLGGEGYLIASLVPAALLSLVQELITATEELHRRSESLQSISRRLHDTEMQLASAAAERDSLRSLMGRTSTAALAAVSAVSQFRIGHGFCAQPHDTLCNSGNSSNHDFLSSSQHQLHAFVVPSVLADLYPFPPCPDCSWVHGAQRRGVNRGFWVCGWQGRLLPCYLPGCWVRANGQKGFGRFLRVARPSHPLWMSMPVCMPVCACARMHTRGNVLHAVSGTRRTRDPCTTCVSLKACGRRSGPCCMTGCLS